jgi:hypothetical protein
MQENWETEVKENVGGPISGTTLKFTWKGL